ELSASSLRSAARVDALSCGGDGSSACRFSKPDERGRGHESVSTLEGLRALDAERVNSAGTALRKSPEDGVVGRWRNRGQRHEWDAGDPIALCRSCLERGVAMGVELAEYERDKDVWRVLGS